MAPRMVHDVAVMTRGWDYNAKTCNTTFIGSKHIVLRQMPCLHYT